MSDDADTREPSTPAPLAPTPQAPTPLAPTRLAPTPLAPTRPGRRPTSAGALLVAMAFLLVLVGVFVGARSLLREQVEVTPTPVDYLAAVEGAQANGIEVFYPAALPDGWMVTSIQLPATSGQPWAIGMLTSDGLYVGLRQESTAPLELTRQQLGDETSLGSEVTIAGAEVELWRAVSGVPDVAGDQGLVSEVPPDALLLYGSADAEALVLIAASLTSAPA